MPRDIPGFHFDEETGRYYPVSHKRPTKADPSVSLTTIPTEYSWNGRFWSSASVRSMMQQMEMGGCVSAPPAGVGAAIKACGSKAHIMKDFKLWLDHGNLWWERDSQTIALSLPHEVAPHELDLNCVVFLQQTLYCLVRGRGAIRWEREGELISQELLPCHLFVQMDADRLLLALENSLSTWPPSSTVYTLPAGRTISALLADDRGLWVACLGGYLSLFKGSRRRDFKLTDTLESIWPHSLGLVGLGVHGQISLLSQEEAKPLWSLPAFEITEAIGPGVPAVTVLGDRVAVGLPGASHFVTWLGGQREARWRLSKPLTQLVIIGEDIVPVVS